MFRIFILLALIFGLGYATFKPFVIDRVGFCVGIKYQQFTNAFDSATLVNPDALYNKAKKSEFLENRFQQQCTQLGKEPVKTQPTESDAL